MICFGQGWLSAAVVSLSLAGLAMSCGCRQRELARSIVEVNGSLKAGDRFDPDVHPLPKPDPAADASLAVTTPVDDNFDPSTTRLVSYEPLDPPVPPQPASIPEPLQTGAPVTLLPVPHADAPSGTEPGEPGEDLSPLALSEVLSSVTNHYPLLRSAMAERQIATGKELAALGEFDTGLKGYSLAEPMGYYKNYRSLVGLSQPIVSGGYLFSGYKIGDGSFPPWYGERETNEGGEFSLGAAVPLWQNREIDKRRAGLAQAQFARQAVEPSIQALWLDFARSAAQAYWTWVAAGQSLEAQQSLLDLARARIDQIEQRVAEGDLERISTINNDRLIASRETKLIEARRKFQAAAIKLSLFLRRDNGEPMLATFDRLPDAFPPHEVPDETRLSTDIERALEARPELRELDFIIRQTRVELAAARNLLHPKLDATLLASKDVGAEANSKGDKTPFQLEAGLMAEVPLQRREAQGKIRAVRGKLAQLSAKREFVVNKTVAGVQDAFSALTAAAERADRAIINVQLAEQSLELGREAFRAGDIDLIVLNIYEQAVNDAQIILIEAQADYFVAVADYDAILVRDPAVE